MKRKVSKFKLITFVVFLLSGCSNTEQASSDAISNAVTPKSDYGKSVAKAREVAAGVESHDKKIKEQTEGLFEE